MSWQQHLDEAAARLMAGEPVAFPTETVYGLGARALDAAAVRRVFARKGRPADNPLIVHVTGLEMLHEVAAGASEASLRLARACWPGPLTLLFPRLPQVPDEVTAGLESVAVRAPAHPVAQALIARVGPLVGPSANLSGSPSPTAAAHVLADFQGQVMVLDGGPCQIGLESAVVDARGESLRVLRPGQLDLEHLARIAQLPLAPSPADADPDAAPLSPGMKYRHYAPRAAVAWLSDLPRGLEMPNDIMVLALDRRDLRGPHVLRFDDLEALARGLYAAFREADARGCAQVLVEPPRGDSGLAQALRNRVEKAAAGR
jgi:L-threonylcarbamoyladenylate synthase